MAVAEIVRSYLEIFLSWPVVTLVLGLLALWSFRAPLADFLRRMGRVEGYGVRIEAMDPLQQRQEAKKAILPENQDALQQYITENPQQVIELYQRTFNSYWFERAFNLIFGSQLELMEHLEAKTEKGERYINLVRFFQEFTRRGGPSTTQLADYLRFLKDIRFLEYLEREGEQYARITSSGVDFLSYLRAQYPGRLQVQTLVSPPMIHLVVDTNILRADISRKNAAFSALHRLASKDKLVLHVPYFVREEFLSPHSPYRTPRLLA